MPWETFPSLSREGREDQQQGRRLLPHPLAVNDTHLNLPRKRNQIRSGRNRTQRKPPTSEPVPECRRSGISHLQEGKENKPAPNMRALAHTRQNKKIGFSWGKKKKKKNARYWSHRPTPFFLFYLKRFYHGSEPNNRDQKENM